MWYLIIQHTSIIMCDIKALKTISNYNCDSGKPQLIDVKIAIEDHCATRESLQYMCYVLRYICNYVK
jgi:hypothetical protein